MAEENCWIVDLHMKVTAILIGFSRLGEFSKGLRSGKGVIQYENGMRFDGGWLDNLRSGYGVQTWPQGYAAEMT